MRILFQLNHPAHYHLLKNPIANLKKKGHQVYILARNKDVLKELLKDEDFSMLKTAKGKNIWQKLMRMKSSENEIIEYVKLVKPEIVIGTGTFSYITAKLKIPTIFLGEDDANLNRPIFLGALMCYPAFSEILSPKVCNNFIWEKKSIKYESYHELAYLHPNHFKPEKSIVEKYFSSTKPYFIIRFAKLNAYHDIGIQGINTEIAQKLIDILKPYADIYITSERELESQFEQYRIKINPLDMHHVMAFGQLYIGDSQTMAAEAGVLGVPFVRFNDFVGRIGYLRELEDVYNLGYGIKTNEVEKLYKTVSDLISMPDRSKVFALRRQKMLSEKIDYAQFLSWFIENYPESAKIMRENPDYQYKFR
jgi:predicted glycosyltransferase